MDLDDVAVTRHRDLAILFGRTSSALSRDSPEQNTISISTSIRTDGNPSRQSEVTEERSRNIPWRHDPPLGLRDSDSWWSDDATRIANRVESSRTERNRVKSGERSDREDERACRVLEKGDERRYPDDDRSNLDR
ncbi:hypothetical protein KM043_012267 [Ampulex compressa]|nr:hypothetical protein KM043_012267 [Ampulex compressa]